MPDNTSDIAHQLRTGRGLTESGKRDAWVHHTMQAAADEIERLEAVLEEILKEAEEAPCSPADPWIVNIQDMVRKALRVEV